MCNPVVIAEDLIWIVTFTSLFSSLLAVLRFVILVEIPSHSTISFLFRSASLWVRIIFDFHSFFSLRFVSLAFGEVARDHHDRVVLDHHRLEPFLVDEAHALALLEIADAGLESSDIIDKVLAQLLLAFCSGAVTAAGLL